MCPFFCGGSNRAEVAPLPFWLNLTYAMILFSLCNIFRSGCRETLAGASSVSPQKGIFIEAESISKISLGQQFGQNEWFLTVDFQTKVCAFDID